KATLMKYHQVHPMRVGMKKSELRSKHFPDITDRLWRDLVSNLRENDVIAESDEAIRLHNHQAKIPSSLESSIENLSQTLKKEDLTVSSWEDLAKKVGLKPKDIPEVRAHLIEQEGYVAMGSDFLVHAQAY